MALDEDLRQRMFDSARTLVSAVGYTNAGTLEFLLDADGNFYFLEVNTRLQVEHPVTEMCTGLDLVELQIRVARGEKLPLTTEEVVRRGAAIECRISAEDVHAGFMPSIGVIREVVEPEGENIRVDSALYNGMPVTLYYDPMLAKVITWGATREAAIETMLEALDGLHIAGISTTAPFCRFVLQHPAFRSGKYSTGFVGEHWTGVDHELDEEILRLAAAAAIRTSERLDERVRSAVIPERIA